MNIGRQSGTFQFQEDPLNKNVQGIGKIYHEVLFLLKFSQTKPQVKGMNITYYDLFNIFIENTDENRVFDDKYENNGNAYITPNHYIGRKKNNGKLR